MTGGKKIRHQSQRYETNDHRVENALFSRRDHHRSLPYHTQPALPPGNRRLVDQSRFEEGRSLVDYTVDRSLLNEWSIGSVVPWTDLTDLAGRRSLRHRSHHPAGHRSLRHRSRHGHHLKVRRRSITTTLMKAKKTNHHSLHRRSLRRILHHRSLQNTT